MVSFVLSVKFRFDLNCGISGRLVVMEGTLTATLCLNV